MSHAPSPTTLWSPSAPPNERALSYTIGDDPHWDSRLLTWDVLGSLGHIAGLRSADLLTQRDHARLHNPLVEALTAIQQGELAIARLDNVVTSAGQCHAYYLTQASRVIDYQYCFCHTAS